MKNDKCTLLWLKIMTDSRLTKSKIVKLHSLFGSIDNIFSLHGEDYEKLSFLKEEDIASLLNESFTEAEKVYEYMLRKGIEMVTLDDEMYPSSLLSISTPPPVLFCIGDISLLSGENMLGVVGSRTPSSYGKDATHHLSFSLAKTGVTIVSGMADGVDSIAHKGALEAGGKTIAVLGCGVDVVYPKENFALYENICKNGLAISEYLPKTSPQKFYFPERNKIIASLSDALLVTEAKEKSGSLITADLCIKYGRKLFSLPGNITSSLCKGTNTLIKNGATAVTSADDILSFFGKEEFKEEKEEMPEMSVERKLIIKALEEKNSSIDTLVHKTSLSLSVLSTELLYMELEGLIKQSAGVYSLALK